MGIYFFHPSLPFIYQGPAKIVLKIGSNDNIGKNEIIKEIDQNFSVKGNKLHLPDYLSTYYKAA